ncbi:hypothetical protein HY091_03495, partial [Candidatus Kaiserbacteria bacterium]|nr:hypothetical protein [Candidatus Kaiserbacteria bacterium]
MAKNMASKKAPAVKPVSFRFDSTAVVKKLLGAASERARDVLMRRFGLGTVGERETLEAIGDRSGITRERVRQIEAAGLDAVRSSRAFNEAKSSFDEIAKAMDVLGVIVPEEELLATFAR